MDVNLEFLLKGKVSDISSDLYEPIIIPTDNYEARLGLKSFATYNNIPNVESNRNNQLKLKVPGHEFEIIAFDTGSYESGLLDNHLREWLEMKYPKLKNVLEKLMLIGNDATS